MTFNFIFKPSKKNERKQLSTFLDNRLITNFYNYNSNIKIKVLYFIGVMQNSQSSSKRNFFKTFISKLK